MKDIYNLNESPEENQGKQSESIFSVFTMLTLFILGNFIVGLLLLFIYLIL